jgi:hypothetical protein
MRAAIAIYSRFEYRKIKRPFPPTASAHPMPLCPRRWAAAETSAYDGTASPSERRVHTRTGVQDAATVRDAAHGPKQGAMGRRGRRTAMPPNPRAVCGKTSGGAGDGGVPPHGSGWRRVGDTRGAVRRKTRRRLPGGHGLGQWEVGLQKVSDAGGSSASPRCA